MLVLRHLPWARRQGAGQFTVLVCISCLAWLERQAGAAQQLLAERPADGQDR